MAFDPNDEENLQIWSFLSDFQGLRSDFIDLARIAYHSVRQLKRTEPFPEDCETLYQGVLLGSQIFRGILHRKRWLRSSFYASYGLAFARYVLHNYWDEISL
jgi:hypothetical protein